jgi:membrane protease YdiL (CAAX protease family)
MSDESKSSERLPDAALAAPPDDDPMARALRGFGPAGLLAVLVILGATLVIGPLSAFLVLVWVRLSRTPWREIGYVRPASWTRTVAIGIALGVGFKLLMKSVVMPMLGAPAINAAYHGLAGNPAALPGAILTMIVVAGFGEETLFRGYLFERLGKRLGTGAGAKVVIVLITSVLFALGHLRDQGLPGAEQALIAGLAFGTMFAISGQIWMQMVAHAAFDLTAVAMIYWNLETRAAHLFFR